MKIEIGESLIYSWLRHVKLCQIVQNNWKVSPKWKDTSSVTDIQKLIEMCNEEFKDFFEYISDVINKAAALPPNTPLEKYRILLPDKWKENR